MAGVDNPRAVQFLSEACKPMMIGTADSKHCEEEWDKVEK
jgi:hypothetical protein